MTLESKKLIKKYYEEFFTGDDGLGLNLTGDLFFNDWLNKIEYRTTLTQTFIHPVTREECEMPLAVLLEDKGAVALVDIEAPLWSYPYFVVSFIVTDNKDGREVFRISRMLRETFIKFSEQGCALPILIDTNSVPMMKRIFDTRIYSEFKGMRFKKLSDQYLIYNDATSVKEVTFNERDMFSLGELGGNCRGNE